MSTPGIFINHLKQISTKRFIEGPSAGWPDAIDPTSELHQMKETVVPVNNKKVSVCSIKIMSGKR